MALRVEIDPLIGIRDLHATSNHPATALEWSVDGASVGLFGPVVSASELQPGQEWTVRAVRGLQTDSASITVPEPPGGNILVILIDDIGVDHVGVYDRNPLAPRTPRIDQLAEEGVRFDRAYASPVCSPSRAILMTGRHARRHGFGWIADTGSRDYALPLASTTIPEALRSAWPAPRPSSLVGKWHLAAPGADDVLTHPLDQGFDWAAGTVGNPTYHPEWGYWRWNKNVNGVVEVSNTYMTTETVDDALARIAAMPPPWFLFLSFNAAHTPLSPPPEHLTTLQVDAESSQDALFDATVEALDTELGRLFDTVDPGVMAQTTVILMGDNGTPSHAIDPPLDPDHGKHTVYEPGIRVPLIIAGPHVRDPGRVSDAQVHIADVLPTVAELSGVPLTGPRDALALDLETLVPLDGRSLAPHLTDAQAPGHALLYVEAFAPNGDAVNRSIDRRSLTDGRFKVVRRGGAPEEFYDLSTDPLDLDDGANLSDDLAQTAFRALADELDILEQTLTFEGF